MPHTALMVTFVVLLGALMVLAFFAIALIAALIIFRNAKRGRNDYGAPRPHIQRSSGGPFYYTSHDGGSSWDDHGSSSGDSGSSWDDRGGSSWGDSGGSSWGDSGGSSWSDSGGSSGGDSGGGGGGGGGGGD
ncbi:hypothetical protein OHA21_40080 [Actinoplanes sp. NBC_00393]|uniref:hypothetical protein n=1 Tax=Actinoplanes sp. NBC_00393 TaxID=2975953 RepID=UPI002E21A12E